MSSDYPHDMDVSEALRQGLVAIIDTGTTGPEYEAACGDGYMPQGSYAQDSLAAVTCTRSKGHKGVHAMVLRWRDPEPVRSVVQHNIPTPEAIQGLTRAMKELALEAKTSAQKMAALHNAADDAMLEAEERRLNKEASMVAAKPFGRKGRISPKGQR